MVIQSAQTDNSLNLGTMWIYAFGEEGLRQEDVLEFSNYRSASTMEFRFVINGEAHTHYLESIDIGMEWDTKRSSESYAIGVEDFAEYLSAYGLKDKVSGSGDPIWGEPPYEAADETERYLCSYEYDTSSMLCVFEDLTQNLHSE